MSNGSICSIWTVHSAERVVFETSATLAKSDSPLASLPLKAIKQFGIAVPARKVRAFLIHMLGSHQLMVSAWSIFILSSKDPQL